MLSRLWRYFIWLGRPLLRHGVFLTFMVILMWTTYSIVGEPRTKNLGFYVQQFFLDLYVVCGVLCVLERMGRRHRVWRYAGYGLKYGFYTVSYIVCFMEAFLYMRFYLAFSPTMLNLALETNGGESREFIISCLQSPKFLEALKIYGGILVANIVCGLWGYRCYVTLCHHRFFRSLLFPLAATTLLVTTFVPWVGEKWKMLDYMTISETTEAEKITGNVFYSPFLRIVYSAKFLHVVQKDIDRLVERPLASPPALPEREGAPLQAEGGGASATQREGGVPTIVLVIGESYNKHHASCYGYGLPTTPNADRLARRGTLTVFSDAVTPWNVTSNAFKAFLSTHSTDQRGSWTDGVLFPALFRQGGYGVGFVTNQFYKSKRQNRSDFNGSFFLNDPRLDSLCFDYRNSRHYKHDGPLLQELPRCRAALKDKEKELYIVHLMGQHVLYKERCPEKERVFTIADYDRPDLSAEERQIIADYDNATRYNDKVFADVLEHFKHDDAVVIYMADHGDEVFDGTIGMFGRNHSADLSPAVLRGEFEVPLLMWTTPKCRRRHPEVQQRIREAADRPFATDDLPHLLLGLAAIATPYYDARRDLLSPTFNTKRPRPIKDLRNYDDIIKK